MSSIEFIQSFYNEKGNEAFDPNDFSLGSQRYSLPLQSPYVYAEKKIDSFYRNGARRILDLGCGTGLHSVRMAKCGFSVIGIDCSEKSLETAQKLAEYHNVSDRITFYCGDALEWMDKCNEKFDCVFTSGVLYYLNIDVLMARLQKSLTTGGHLLSVETFGGNPFMNILRKRRNIYDEQTLNRLHRSKEIKDLCSRFKKSEVIFFNFLELGGVFFNFSKPVQRIVTNCIRPLDYTLLNTFHLRCLAWKYVFCGEI
ncbi:MAG: class I SAM-dependent methyltransferase [Planctomycetaceae bacterium]|jgi:SAM-dependent methyltransferase|nr:class I SAM-dependent methyltransferase [Planctomycetaceae bacterium]